MSEVKTPISLLQTRVEEIIKAQTPPIIIGNTLENNLIVLERNYRYSYKNFAKGLKALLDVEKMSEVKTPISLLQTRVEQSIQVQDAAVKSIEDNLIKLGRNYDSYSCKSFAKALKILLKDLDVDEHLNNFRALSEEAYWLSVSSSDAENNQDLKELKEIVDENVKKLEDYASSLSKVQEVLKTPNWFSATCQFEHMSKENLHKEFIRIFEEKTWNIRFFSKGSKEKQRLLENPSARLTMTLNILAKINDNGDVNLFVKGVLTGIITEEKLRINREVGNMHNHQSPSHLQPQPDFTQQLEQPPENEEMQIGPTSCGYEFHSYGYKGL